MMKIMLSVNDIADMMKQVLHIVLRLTAKQKRMELSPFETEIPCHKNESLQKRHYELFKSD